MRPYQTAALSLNLLTMKLACPGCWNICAQIRVWLTKAAPAIPTNKAKPSTSYFQLGMNHNIMSLFRGFGYISSASAKLVC